MNPARPTASGLMRCRVITRDGRRVGRVQEIRCHGREGDPPTVSVLLIGTTGLLRRLGVRRGRPQEIPWRAVVDWRAGEVVVDLPR